MLSSLFEVACNSPFKVPHRKIASCCEGDEDKKKSPVDTVEFGTLQYFALCGIGGVLSVGSTHLLVVPLDVIKCRLQVDKEKYKNLFHGIRVTVN